MPQKKAKIRCIHTSLADVGPCTRLLLRQGPVWLQDDLDSIFSFSTETFFNSRRWWRPFMSAKDRLIFILNRISGNVDRVMNLLALLITASVVQFGVHSQNLAPAPSANLPQRCQTCPRADQNTPLNLTLNVITGTDVAQFYSYTTEGAILVYFVARANFSVAPAQLSLTSFDIDNGKKLSHSHSLALLQFDLTCTMFAWRLRYSPQNNDTYSHNLVSLCGSSSRKILRVCYALLRSNDMDSVNEAWYLNWAKP